MAKEEGKEWEGRGGRASRKLKRRMLFTMSSRSGTEVPDGGVMSQHGLQSSAGGQDSSSGVVLQDSCVDFDTNRSEPRIPNFDAAGSEEYSFLKILDASLQVNMRTHVGLRDFILLSLEYDPHTVHSGRPSGDLLPCPPPRWSWTGSSKPSPKRRRRIRFHVFKHRLIQQIVATLNWEALGHVKRPPPAARVGFPLSSEQVSMLDRLDSLVDHFTRAGNFTAASLGRSADKLDRLLEAAKELPDLVEEVDLTAVVSHVKEIFDPYSKSCDVDPPKSESTKETKIAKESSQSFDRLSEKISLDACTAKPVVADRIKWEHSPQFDPRPFLVDPIVRRAFEDPNFLRLPEDQWEPKPAGKIHCTRAEVLKLAQKWDAKGACRIFTSDLVKHDEAVGIFAVPKDQDYDRLILNPVVVNGRMKSYSNYTKQLAPGCMIGLVQLKSDEVLRISADDLAEMYYTFQVPDRRAIRNCLRVKFKASELSHLSCFDPAKHHGECYISLGALAMGDSLAVEIAQQAHHQVLFQIAGSMRSQERVAYRLCFPRGKFFEFLAIDDHLGLQVLTKTEFKSQKRKRDSEVFERAGAAYLQVGLVQHPRKRRRGVTSGIFLGAEVDGLLGRVSAPRHRIGMLMLCSSIIARKGTCTPRLLSMVVGAWVSVLMFRRPIMSVMQAVFNDAVGRAQDTVFRLSQQCRNELLVLSILGPLAQTDMRTDTCPKLFCLDASPYGAGICESVESENVISELWRHSEQRGFYTKLSNPASAVLQELGLEHEPEFGVQSQFHSTFVPHPEKHLRPGVIFDCIELFKGEGNWSLAHSEVNFTVHAGLDIHGRRVEFGDLRDKSVFRELLSLALRGAVRDWHGGPPCFTFGTLRRPRIRSKLRPNGFCPSNPLTAEQNSLALRTAFLFSVAMDYGAFVSIEQPGSSVMFYMHAFKVLAMKGCVLSKFCFCAYGSGFKKPSKWLHNKPWMLEVESKCTCSDAKSHCLIEGSFTPAKIKEFEEKCRPDSVSVYGRAPRAGESVASYSASYPLPFVRRIAAGAQAFKHGDTTVIPISRKVSTLHELGCIDTVPSGLAGSAQPALRQWYEDPEWVEEIADSSAFIELPRYKFHKSSHINVLEARTYKTWLKHCSKKYPNNRLLALLDSRVTLGATAKGRSSSFAISRVLQGSLGYILGGGLYPGGLHICSAKNRSDAPSRNRKVPPPSKETPLWLLELRKGNTEPFDTILAASGYHRPVGRWIRLLLLLAGDVERNPGPAVRGPYVRRGPLDMDGGVTPATSKRMDDCMLAFRKWTEQHCPGNFNEICCSAYAVATALRGYGCYLYEGGFPRYMLTYAITAIADALPHFRSQLQPAWQIDRKWQALEPGECRPVLSAPIMRSMVTTALFWNWHYWVAVSMIGYLGMLHPSEFINLSRKDLVLPRDAMINEQVLYVHIKNPKTARFARRQHCKLEDPVVIRYLDALYGANDLSVRLYPGSASMYRRQWDAILSRLGVPHSRAAKGATPAVLRGSGATHLYLATEDIGLVQWRGRWTKQKTIEFYLQEVAAQLMLHDLDVLARERIRKLALAARPLLHMAADSFGELSAQAI